MASIASRVRRFVASSKGPIQYLIGLGLLTHIVWSHWEGKAGVPGLREMVHHERRLTMLLLATACIVAATALQFSRWYLLVRGTGLPFTAASALRLGLLGLFYNTFLPGSVGGDALKAYFLARENPQARAAALASVVADRMFGLFSLFTFVTLVGGGFWLGGNRAIATSIELQRVIESSLALVAIAVAAWVAIGFWPQSLADGALQSLRAIPKVGASLAGLWTAGWTYRRRPGVVAACLGLSLLNHFLYVMVFHFAAAVFARTTASLPEHLSAVPIAYAFEGFFPAPGGVGGGEAIFGYLYRLLERPEIVGITGKLAMRVAQWGVGAVGFIAYLQLKAQLPPRP